MQLNQFINTIVLILNNNHINKFRSIYKHLQWQLRKLFNLFPYQQKFSESLIIAENKYNGVSALINCMGIYDYNNMNLIKLLLKQGGIFFDIGANIGSYTLIASEQANANVYSFEAHPGTFLSLKKNIILNNRDNVKAFNIAVSETDGNVFFSNLVQTPINHIMNNNVKNCISVDSIRLDTFIKKNNVMPEYVKIDVEGFEYNVLSGIGKYLEFIKVLFIEYNQHTGKNSINDLLSENFIGPLSFAYDNLTFKPWLNNNIEDCVYVLRNYQTKLINMKYNFKF